jgi:hypothetical protein
MTQALFVIRDLPEGSGRLLDIWQVEPISIAYTTRDAETGSDAVITWSVSLPADPLLAQHLVETQAGLIRQQQQRLVIAEQNLRHLNLASPSEVAFTSGEVATEESPEMTLRRNLAQMQATDMVAFGLRDWLPHWQKTVADYEAYLNRILDLLKPTMRIETMIEERQIACTIIRWNGHLQTAVHPGLATPQAQLHHQTLALVWQTRLALLQLLAKAASGAAILAAKLSLPFPAGPLLALPAAWQYLQDLQQQVGALANFQNDS